tara:strand:+ start:320 stop:682 length:363 start_codon:yes stop_codon:yes gene_type:complete
MSKYELYDSLVKPPPHCQCEDCYCSDFEPSRFFPCPRGAPIKKQWTEYYKRRRALREEQLRIEREKRVISPAELKAKEREKEKARIVREGGKTFYDFIFYASLLYLIVLKCYWDMGYVNL